MKRRQATQSYSDVKLPAFNVGLLNQEMHKPSLVHGVEIINGVLGKSEEKILIPCILEVDEAGQICAVSQEVRGLIIP